MVMMGEWKSKQAFVHLKVGRWIPNFIPFGWWRNLFQISSACLSEIIYSTFIIEISTKKSDENVTIATTTMNNNINNNNSNILYNNVMVGVPCITYSTFFEKCCLTSRHCKRIKKERCKVTQDGSPVEERRDCL